MDIFNAYEIGIIYLCFTKSAIIDQDFLFIRLSYKKTKGRYKKTIGINKKTIVLQKNDRSIVLMDQYII